MAGFEIDFLPVGDGERSGDAIALRYGLNGVFLIHVVDGGDAEAGEALVAHIRRYYGNPRHIDHVVLSHGDDDHSSGLRPVIDAFEIGTIWMNRPWLYAAETIGAFRDPRFTVEGLARRLRTDFPIMAEIEDKAHERGIPICEAFQGAQIGLFTVLSPTRQRYIRFLPHLSRTPAPAQPQAAGIGALAEALMRPEAFTGGALNPFARAIAQPRGILGALAEASSAGGDWVAESWGWETLSEDASTPASNETSVVQIAQIDGRNILLTGDAGVVSLREAAAFAEQAGYGIPGLWFMQAPHHGSRRNISPSVLDRWLGARLPAGQTRDTTVFASVAAGSDTHPRRKVVNALMRRGASVHVTKGLTKSHSFNMPNRGWDASQPLGFSNRVEA